MIRYVSVVACLLVGCAAVPDSVPAAMDARARIEADSREAYRALVEATLLELDEAWWQFREAEHEARILAAATDGRVAVATVLSLRQHYEAVAEKNAASLAALRSRLAAIERGMDAAGELDAGVRRVLVAMRERATAAEGLTDAAIQAARVAGEADVARRAARAERKQRERAEAAAEEGGADE